MAEQALRVSHPDPIGEQKTADSRSRPPFKERLRRWAFGTLSAKGLAKRVWTEANEDDLFSIAAQLAYYFLFALFPLLLFLVTLIGFLPIENLFGEIAGFLQEILPQEALTLVQSNIEAITQDQRGGLLSVGLLATLWAASRAVANISAALNQAYDVKETRPWWKVQGIALLLTVSLSLFVIVAVVLMIFGGQIGEWVVNFIGLGFLFEITWNIIRLFLAALIMMGVMGLLYYFAPDVEQKWRWVTPGSVFAVIGWIGASLAFAFYVNNFGSYNKTYGTIGAVIILLTWMYITALMILIGGEINSVIETSMPEGKNPGEKRIAENHPNNLLLKARAKVPVKSKFRRWLFSPWSIGGAVAALSATIFLFKRNRSHSSEA